MAKGKAPRKVLKKSVSTATDTMKMRIARVKILKKPMETPSAERYPEDRLKKLVSDLGSGNSDLEVEASVEFITNYDSIVLAINNTPNLTETVVLEKVVENIIKQRQKFFDKLAREGRKRELEFLSKSKSIPKSIGDDARNVLNKIDKTYATQRQQKAEKIIGATPVSAKELKAFIINLKSGVSGKAILATIKFLSNYQRFAVAINMTPQLSVTQVNKAVAAVLERHSQAVLRELKTKRNVKALTFLSSFSAAPIALRNQAKEALSKVQVKAPEKSSEVVAVPIQEKTYTVQNVEKLHSQLGSKDIKVAVPATIELFNNYSKITEILMKTPMLSVTDVTKRAVDVLTKNSKQIFDILKTTKNVKVLKFLSKSSDIPDEISKKAEFILNAITPKKDEKKKKIEFGVVVTQETPEGEGGEEEEEGESEDEEEREERQKDWTKFK